MTYLDTHVVLWLYAQKGQGLSDKARHLIEESTSLLISPIVLLEMDFLHEIGRISVGSDLIFPYLEQNIGLTACAKPFLDVIHLAPQQTWTRDPFDRIITAQASIDLNVLITKDNTIHQHYSQSAW